MFLAPERLPVQSAVERARRATVRLGISEPDWAAVRDVLGRADLRRSVVAAALGLTAACEDLLTAGQRACPYVWPYLDEVAFCEQALVRRLWLRALIGGTADGRGTSPSRRVVREQARKMTAALDDASGRIYTMERAEGARTCAQIAMGIVHHQVSGASLPALCSTGHDW